MKDESTLLMNGFKAFCYGSFIGFLAIPSFYLIKSMRMNNISRLTMMNSWRLGPKESWRKMKIFFYPPILFGGFYGLSYTLFFRYYWDHVNINRHMREFIGHAIFFSLFGAIFGLQYIGSGAVFGMAVGIISYNKQHYPNPLMVGEYVNYQKIDSDLENEIKFFNKRKRFD